MNQHFNLFRTLIFAVGFSFVFVVCLSVEQKQERNIIKREKVFNVRNNRINSFEPEQIQDVPYQNENHNIRVVHKRLSKDLRAHAAKKNQSITCPELHNYTFTNDPPFDVLGIPECGEQVQPMMMLYFPPMNKTKIKSEDNSKSINPDEERRIINEYEEERNITLNDEQKNQGPKEKDDNVTRFDQISDSDKNFDQNSNKKRFSKERVKIVLNGEENELEDFMEHTKYGSDSQENFPQNLERNQEMYEIYSDVDEVESERNKSVTENFTQNGFRLSSNDEDLESLLETTVQCELIPSCLPNNVTDNCLRVLNARKDLTKVVILIHGFLNSFTTGWMHQMQSTIQELEPHTAIIIYGWGHGLGDLWNYWRAARNARYAARTLYEMIKFVQEQVQRPLYIHCAGHSLGAHVCGIAGKYLIQLNDPKIRKFHRISGMDPAGPMFCNDVPYPFSNLHIDPSARLGPTDADLVDVIHTDGNARYLDYIPQYGTLESLGTVDFYPGYNNQYYGCYQPGCYDVVDVVSCSHSRSHQLYAASIDEAVCMASRKCDGDPHKIPKDCKFLNGTKSDEKLVTMGYWLDIKDPPTGLYTVEVDGYAPFCL